MSQETHLLTAEAVGVNWPIIGSLLEHTELVQPVVGYVKTIFDTGDTPQDRWNATKALGDLLLPLGIEVITGDPVTEHQLKALQDKHPAVGKNGVIIGLLLQNLPQIMAFITQLVPLFKVPTPAPTPVAVSSPAADELKKALAQCEQELLTTRGELSAKLQEVESSKTEIARLTALAPAREGCSDPKGPAVD